MQPDVANIFIDIIPDMCFVVSAERRVLSCNRRAREVLGFPEGMNGEVMFYDLLTDDSPRPLLPVLRTMEGAPEAEVRFKAPGGGVVDALLFIRKIRGPERVPLRHRPRRLGGQEEGAGPPPLLQRRPLHRQPQIQITDARGRMIYVNPAFEKATGYSKEELIGANPNMISSHKYPRELWGRIWAKINAGDVWTGQVENRGRRIRSAGCPVRPGE